MKILILGSEGFIGSNAVKYFKTQGYKVTGADIVLKETKDYLFINPEIPIFSEIFAKQKFDVCINATGAANVQFSFTHPAVDYILNVSNVYNILDSIRKYNSKCKFMNLSSAAVYGNPETLPISESSDLRPVSPYGYHKMYSEQICKEFYSHFDIATISVRVFSAYGEGLKKQLFWDLHQKIKTGKDEIEMFGDGDETRDFIYIHDLVNALDRIIQKASFNGEAINIASGIESSIKNAIDLFIKSSSKKVSVKFKGENKKGDPKNWCADISLLKSLGFTNHYSLEQGIYNYTRWLKEKE